MAKEGRRWELVKDAGPHRHRHEDGSQVAYEAGEVIHDERDLAQMWPGKFNELGKPQFEKRKDSKLKKALAARLNSAQEAAEIEDHQHDTEEEDVTLAKSEYGEDVTAEFTDAARSDLKVFHDAETDKFTVCDADDLEKPLAKGLKRSKNVLKWVREYRRGNTDVTKKPKIKKKGKKIKSEE